MSSDSLKQSGVSSQTRSISDIIESLRKSFQPSDYKVAVNELIAREEGLRLEKASLVASLREKSDYFEGERNELKLEKIQWKEERRRLLREFDVKEDQLKEVTRKLSSVKEDEEKAVKRYNGLFKELKDMMEEKDELIRNLAGMTSMVDTLKRNLREKEGVIDDLMREKESRRDSWLEELAEAQKKIENLENEKQRFEARVEVIKREKEESLKDMVRRNEVEKRETEDIRRKNVILVEQKMKSDDIVKNLSRCDEEKDERIKKLSEDMELLKREKINIAKEKDRKIQELEEEKGILDLERREIKTKLGKVEKGFLKLEEDVIACLCLELGRDKNFAGSQFGKILSKIIMALDSEDFDLSNGLEKDGIIQEADSALNYHANEPERGMKSEKQPVEDVRRTLVFGCNDATENKRTTCGNPIIIDSDDENENTQHSIGVKNKRHYSGSLSKHQNYNGSSDDSLKTKKLKHVQCEQVKQELSSATKSDHKLNSQRQTPASINIGEEKPKREVTGPKSCSFSKDNDKKVDGSKSDFVTPKTDPINKRIEELTNAFRQRKQNKRLECEADMVCAFDQDFDLCANAVCALYRHKKSWSSPLNGSRSGRSQECDIERMNVLANYLTDGNPRGKMKKSIDELQKHDPRGPDDCRRLAKGYSKQLIDIYRKREDPFFSPSSTELQYK